MAICVAGFGSTVTMILVGDPPGVLTVSVSVPAVGLSVQPVIVALPSAPVVIVPGWIVPPPTPGVSVRVVLGTGLPSISVTSTTGLGEYTVPTLPLPPLPETIVMVVAVPAVSVTGAVIDGTPVMPKLRLRRPTVPPSVSAVKVARPEASVVTVAFVRVPPPLATVTVMVLPATFTGFPYWSCNSMTGCVPNAVRFAAVVLGCVTKTSWLGGPAATVAVKGSGLLTSPTLVAVTVCVPAFVPKVQAVLARPCAFEVVEAVVTTPAVSDVAKVTTSPATELPAASETLATTGALAAVLTVPVWLLPLETVSCTPGGRTRNAAVPEASSTAAVIVALPAATAVATPLAFTVAIAVLDDDHWKTTPVIVLPAASFATAVYGLVCARAVAVCVDGVTVMVATGTAGAVTVTAALAFSVGLLTDVAVIVPTPWR